MVIGDQDKICGNCGYNPQTDTMTTSFVKKKQKAAFEQKQSILSPGVKSFVFWGMIIIVFSLGVKYHGKVGDIIWKAKNKSAQASRKASQNKVIRLMDVRSFKAPVDRTVGKNRKIEGIFYDPQGKSYVVINGRLVSENESYGSMFIKKINSNSVEVLQDGKKQVLRVSK
jgi:hypothetical protein